MYKFHIRHFVLFASVLILLITSSCSKKKEDRIKDTWRYIEVKNIENQTAYEVWDLSDGENITVAKYPIKEATNPKLVGSGRYEIQKSFTSPFYIVIYGIGPYYDGKWEVLEIKKDRLIILLDQHPYWIFREFRKY